MSTLEETNSPENEDDRSKVVSSSNTKKKRVAIITVSLCAILLIAGVFYWLSVRAREETTDAYVTGRIDLVSARVPGTVQTVKVDDNQIVGKDDVLVQLDPNDLRLKVALAKAVLDAAEQQAATAKTAITFSSQSAAAGNTQAEAGVAQAEAGVGQAEAGAARSQDMLRQADADLERAALDDKRFENLLARHEVSQQQYDHTHTAYKIALANDGGAKAGVREAEAALARATGGLKAATGGLQAAHAAFTDVDLRGKQYQSALANVEAARAAYGDATLQLSYTVIHASAGGTIGNKTVEVGQRVQPGQPLLAVVEPEVWVVANFKETQLAHVEDGQPVEIKIDRIPEKRFIGHVQSFSPATGANFSLLPPENATGNFVKVVQRVPVKIVFDPDSVRGYDARIVPGLSAVVTARSR